MFTITLKFVLICNWHLALVRFASGQLSKLFNATHDFYYAGCDKPYKVPVVVFTRNPVR
jgi:hypothetical protein